MNGFDARSIVVLQLCRTIFFEYFFASNGHRIYNIFQKIAEKMVLPHTAR